MICVLKCKTSVLVSLALPKYGRNTQINEDKINKDKVLGPHNKGCDQY